MRNATPAAGDLVLISGLGEELEAFRVCIPELTNEFECDMYIWALIVTVDGPSVLDYTYVSVLVPDGRLIDAEWSPKHDVVMSKHSHV